MSQPLFSWAIIGKKIYSVDMMIAANYFFKAKTDDFLISEDVKKMIKSWPSWVNPSEDDKFRIKHAKLKFPIIVSLHDGSLVILDGVHRLAKAVKEKKKKLKAYVISEEHLNKFLVNNKGNWDKVDRMRAFDLIKLFIERFVKKK